MTAAPPDPADPLGSERRALRNRAISAPDPLGSERRALRKRAISAPDPLGSERRALRKRAVSAPDPLGSERRALRKRAISIAVALLPFGFAFGISVAEAGLSPWHAVGFSMLVFSGGSQFAAIGVLRDHGSPTTAIASALLLGLRLLAYGVVMTPHLPGSRWTRALDSHLMIDESIAVGTAARDPSLVRYGYRWGGLSIFVCWNVSTLAGVLVGANAGDLIQRFGIDAAVPASFLALVWPRLTNRQQLPVALLGGAIALVLIPLAPAGIPILASGLAAAISFRRPRQATT